MIVHGFYAALARLHAGDFDARITKVAFGTSGTPATEDDTTITAALVKPIDSVTVPPDRPRALRFAWSLAPDEAVGMAIREIGLMTEDGALVTRTVRNAPIEKTADLALGDWVEIQL